MMSAVGEQMRRSGGKKLREDKEGKTERASGAGCAESSSLSSTTSPQLDGWASG